MDFSFSEVQHELRAVARRYLEQRYPIERVAALADAALAGATGWDPDGWAPLARLGWWDPGLGLVEAALLAQECGYTLLPVPWHGALTVAGALPAAVLDGAVDLRQPVATALGCASTVTARRDGEGWRLDGTVPDVADAGHCAILVLAASTVDDADGLFVVDLAAPGVVRTAGESIDPLRGSWALRGTEARAWSLSDATGATPTALARRGAVLRAAEAIGVAGRAHDLAVDHAKTRVQFGRPIGSFQAVSAGLADRFTDIELARSLVYRAAWLADAGDTPDSTVDCAVAEAVFAARSAAVAATEWAIQVHGGLGMTWEFPLHLWYRRALRLASSDTPSETHLARVATALLRPSL